MKEFFPVLTEEQSEFIKPISKMFMRNGFYKVSMDDIAAELKISKKTLYKHFDSKEHLVECCIKLIASEMVINIDGIVANKDDAILKITQLLEVVGKMIIKISDKFFYDLENYLPELWQKIDGFRTQMLKKNFSKIIAQGKKEGLIIDQPDEIILTIYISAIQNVINPKFLIYTNYSFNQALEITFDILLNGISTKKGKNIFKNNYKQKSIKK